jgi:hypothetical protein
MTNEFVAEGEAGHQTALLQLDDRSKGTREEDTLHSGEGNTAFYKRRTLVRNPMEGPVILANCFVGIKEVITLGGVLDVSINEERVSFGVDILRHDLETVEAVRLGHLNFIGEMLVEVLVNDAVGGCEEGENCEIKRRSLSWKRLFQSPCTDSHSWFHLGWHKPSTNAVAALVVVVMKAA